MRPGFKHIQSIPCWVRVVKYFTVQRRNLVFDARTVKSSDQDRISMSDLGKLLIFLGGFLVLAGLLTLVLGRTNFPLGRLPGDFVYRGKHTSFYFPLATSILLSFVLSFVLYLINRWRR